MKPLGANNAAENELTTPKGAFEKLISQCGLSTKSAILKIVNSPAYGLVRSVSNIKQAIMFLGWNGIEALVPSLKLKQMFAQKECCISLERFWDFPSGTHSPWDRQLEIVPA